jgi:hypothetical protein
MRIRAFAAAALAVFLTTACHKPSSTVAAASAKEAHFAVVLERSATGWAAHCEAGCQWIDVTLACQGCDVQLDASGISRAFLAPAPKGFAFVLSDAKGGWTARGIQGVRWQKLSWNCGANLCRGRLDETGVKSVS